MVKGGSVLAQGYNLPIETAHAHIENPKAPSWCGLHAEIACLRSATEDQTRDAVLYVAGISSGGGLLCTRPCEWCWDAIKDSGLAGVVWHEADGSTCKFKLRGVNGGYSRQ